MDFGRANMSLYGQANVNPAASPTPSMANAAQHAKHDPPCTWSCRQTGFAAIRLRANL
jgi:hypothetical protein